MSESLELLPSHALQQWTDAQENLKLAIQRYLDSTITLQSNLYSSIHPTNAASVRNTLAQTWLDDCPVADKHSKLTRAQKHVNQIRNSFLSINTLPLEILLRIFRFTAFKTFHAQYSTPIPYSYQQDDHRDLIVLTHVCSYWRTVLLNTPSFWSQFVSDPRYYLGDECERAAVYSNRANGVPQSLSFYEQLDHRSFYWYHFDTMTKIIEPRLDNLTQMTLLNFEDIRLVTRIITFWLNNGRPGALRSLTIQLEPKAMYPKPIFTGNAQQAESILGPIRTLSLRGITFAWDSPIYWNLVMLRIGNINLVNYPTIDEMLGVLSACPLLHTLRLYGMGILPGHSTSLEPVYLTELENLNLALLTPQSVGLLLPRLFPQRKDLSLRLGFQTWDARSFDVVYPFLARTNVTRLFIEQCAHPESDTVLGRCLSSSPNLHTLILDLASKPGDSFLSGFTCPDESNTGRIPRCPRLHTIYFVTGSVTVEAVQQIVETHPLIRKLRFLACYVEPFEDELRYWLGSFVKDVKFELRLDMAALFDWYHIMN
ncbi:hypothetical protein FRC11_005630 [Ceratobasidium sp. 423]|nr:hypothetical protein FRC11_005630 [Ceratobasidium sp. 423]